MVDFPSAVAVPSTASYAPPLLDFSQFANLANTFRQGQQANQKQSLNQAFPNGLPTDPTTGQPDYRAIANILAQKGDIGGAVSLAPQISQQGPAQISPFLSGGSGPMASTPAAGSQAATTAPATVAAAPADTGGNPTTVLAMANSALPQSDTTATVAANIARAVGVDPNQPLTIGQQTRVNSLINAYRRRTGAQDNAGTYAPTIASAADQYGLDPSLLTRQLGRESSFNPNAKSSAGAEGIAQFMPATAKRYGVDVADASSSITGAAHYDADLLKKFGGNEGLALAGYNWGEGNVQKWLDAGADPAKMPKETRDYVQSISGQPIDAWTKSVQQPTTANARVAQDFGNFPPSAGMVTPSVPRQPAQATAQPQQQAPQQQQPAAATAPQQGGPLPNVIPLPINPATGQRFTDPWEAIQAVRAEAARRAASPRPSDRAQVPALDALANDIEKSLQLLPVRPGEAMFNPRTGQVAFQAPGGNAANIALQRFLEANPDATPEQIQAFQQSGRSGRSAISMYMNRYLQEHPDADAEEVKRAAQQFTTQTTAQNRFLSGPQGNTIRSLNVVVSHLQTMQDLGDALGNGNIRAFNSLAQRFAEETGQPAPTNFDTAKQIVGAEVIKALGVAGAGSQAERQEAADAFNRARSPAQLAGAINAARRLLVGQLEGLRRQYVASTGLPGSTFDDMLEPETRSFFGQDRRDQSDQTGGGSSQGGGSWTTLPNGVRIREVQ